MCSYARSVMRHLKEVRETYWQHFKFAAFVSRNLFVAAGAAIIHAIFPFLLETTASNKINEVHIMLKTRNEEPEPLDEDKELFI